MKTAFALIIVIIVMLACGCTASAPAQQAASPATGQAPASGIPAPVGPVETPSLVGTWAGTMAGYEKNTGFTTYNNTPIRLVVTEQKGRIFSCYVTFGHNSTEQLACAGVIGSNGRTFALVEDVNGYTTGELTGPDTMELIHIDDAQPFGAALDTLKRE